MIAVPALEPGVNTQFLPSAVIVPRSSPLLIRQTTSEFVTRAGINVALRLTALPPTQVIASVLFSDTPATSAGAFERYVYVLLLPAPILIVSIKFSEGVRKTTSSVSSLTVSAGRAGFSRSYLDNAALDAFTVVLTKAYPFSEYPK